MADYQKYFNDYMKNVNPQITKQLGDLKATLADRGLGNTTAGQGTYANTSGNLFAKAALDAMGYAENARQFDRNDDTQRYGIDQQLVRQNDEQAFQGLQNQYDRRYDYAALNDSRERFDNQLKQNSAQFNTTQANDMAKFYGNAAIQAQTGLWGHELGLIASANDPSKVKTPNTSNAYKNLINGKAPVGDALESDDSLYEPYAGKKTLGDVYGDWKTGDWYQIENQRKANETNSWIAQQQVELDRAKQALAERVAENEIALSQAQAAAEGAGGTNDAVAVAQEAYIQMLDDKGNPIITGQPLRDHIQALSGLDYIEEARNGEAWAIGILRRLYPQTWRDKLNIRSEKTAAQTAEIDPAKLALMDFYRKQNNERRDLLRSVETAQTMGVPVQSPFSPYIGNGRLIP